MSDESFILMDLKDDESKKIAQVISNDTSRKILNLLSHKDNITATEISKELDSGLSTIHYNLQHLIKARLIESTDFHYSEKGKEVDHYKLSNKIVIIAPQRSKMDSIKEKLKGIIPVGLFAAGTSALLHLLYNNPFLKSNGKMESFSIKGNDLARGTPEMDGGRIIADELTSGSAKEIATENIPGIMSAEPIASVANSIESATLVMDTVSEEVAKTATSKAMAFTETVASNVTNNVSSIVNNIAENTPVILKEIPREIIIHQSNDPNLIGVWFFLGCISTLIIYLLFETYKAGKTK